MAERIQVELVDDIDGSPAQHTITFALDGVTYEIDLSDRHSQQLRSLLGRYIERARTPQRASRRSRQEERTERQTRQANRQLTEQIRGAAQRTRDRLSQMSLDDVEQEDVDQEQDSQEVLTLVDPEPNPAERVPESEEDTSRSTPVSLPQFSSAVE